MQAFSAGTLAGAGSFRCTECGFAVALQELDEIPACPHCGGDEFRRSSMFKALEREEVPHAEAVDDPDWLAEARDALVRRGAYVAYEADERVRVLPLQDGWTRIGRGLSAHVRLDDPTVSRRHALIHRDEDCARILDDRSLNGVFLNGDRIEWHELADGDEILIGSFRLYYIDLTGKQSRAVREEVGSAVG